MPHILTTREGAVATLTIQRPKALNALNAEVLSELSALLTSLAEEGKTQVIILTGAGRAFVAGADIKAMAEMTPGEAWVFSRRGHEVMRLLAEGPWVSMAAVNGYAMGGGCELALACNLIYASERAVFGQPEVALGLVPGFGGTQRLAQVVGEMRARELILTGRRVRAEEALQIGLVVAVFPGDDLMVEVQKRAQEVAAHAPLAVQRSKDLIMKGASLSLEEGNRLESEVFASLFATEDMKEGIAAFLGKRKADFKGK